MKNVQIPIPDPPLGDDAVVLRPWSLDDVPAVTAACQDPEIARWTTVPAPYREEDARLWLESVTNPEAQDRLALAMTRAADGALVGSISLWIVRPGVAEFGYFAVAGFRGRGYTTRALRLLAAWALDQLKLPRLQLGTLPGNTSSERVAEKAGFRREGILRSYIEQRGERRDVLMWSLLPDELR
jgi:RimJ/RimL family protein N-acetyltransferase